MALPWAVERGLHRLAWASGSPRGGAWTPLCAATCLRASVLLLWSIRACAFAAIRVRGMASTLLGFACGSSGGLVPATHAVKS